MTGPHDSIIGMDREGALSRFLNGMPSRFEPATGNPRLNGIVLQADESTGLATAIARVSCSADDLERLVQETKAVGARR
jgi:calcineurin-like phosphoesterase